MGVKLQYKVAVNEETARGGAEDGNQGDLRLMVFFVFPLSVSVSV